MYQAKQAGRNRSHVFGLGQVVPFPLAAAWRINPHAPYFRVKICAFPILLQEHSMAVDIKTLKGMSDDILAKLADKGVKDTEQLLAAVRSPAQRKELAGHCDVTPRDILELGNRADLSRIKGVAGVYSDLLEQAGVDTVPELAQRRADNLHAKIVATNDEAGLTKQPPTADAVAAWVEQAKGLQRAIEY